MQDVRNKITEDTGVEVLAQLKTDPRNDLNPLTTAEITAKKLSQYNFNDLLGKRLTSLNGPERVTLVMYLVNKQVAELDDLIQGILSSNEQDFLLAYKVSAPAQVICAGPHEQCDERAVGAEEKSVL